MSFLHEVFPDSPLIQALMNLSFVTLPRVAILPVYVATMEASFPT